jgi:hypothetical protein
MKASTIGASLVLMGVVGAWSADCIVDGALSHFAAPDPAGTDDTLELKWDSGSVRWWLAYYTGAGTWISNDFDISTISGYAAVQAMKLQSRNNWPNYAWDGFRLGVYNFAGGIPGSLLWGPKFVMPTGVTGWHEFSVNWTLPSGTHKFLASYEQFYNYPNCDVLAIDDNPTFLGHSWLYYQGQWSPFSGGYYTDPYRNVMIRVIVNNSTLKLKPSSIGRVKALYY